jgi:penicillin-binding protein 1A
VLAWDLGRANAKEIDPEDAEEKGVGRMARTRPLEAGEVYAAVVVEADDRQATVDLGSATGTLALADLGWARKWNPAEPTSPPRKASQVVGRGDVVLVRVMPGKIPLDRAVREKRPLPLALEQTPTVQGALVAIDPVTRGVRALVGGYDFQASQFNRATQARRQPGSAFKPFVWGAAVESRRYTPATIVYDTPDLYRDPWTGKEWKPRNFEKDSFDGPMLLGDALAHSKNTVSVKLVDAMGPDAVAAFARRLGISSDLPRNLTLGLGTGEVSPLELTNAYASIAAHGFEAEPLVLLRVRDRKGKVLEEHAPVAPWAIAPDGSPVATVAVADPSATTTASPSPSPSPPALAGGEVRGEGATAPTIPSDGSTPPGPAATAPPPPFTIPASGTRPDVAFVLSSMMRQVVESGTGVAAKALGRPAAAKTGTAQEHRDAWFVGFTPELCAGVWVGFDDHGPLGPRETGAGAALPPWLSFMQAALGGRAPSAFDVVPGVELVRIDPATGRLASDRQGSAPFAAFLTGTAPASAGPGAAPQNFFMDDR